MSQDSETTATRALDQRVAAIEKTIADRAIHAVYARLYAPLGVAAVLLTAVPLFADQRIGDGLTRDITSTLEQAATGRGQPAGLGLVVVIALLVLVLMATAREPHPAVPAGIAVLAVLLMVMITVKLGYSEPKPELSYAGIVGLVVGGMTVTLSVTHLIHSVTRRFMSSRRK